MKTLDYLNFESPFKSTGKEATKRPDEGCKGWQKDAVDLKWVHVDLFLKEENNPLFLICDLLRLYKNVKLKISCFSKGNSLSWWREASESLPVPVLSGREQGGCIPASQRCRKVRTPLWNRWSRCWSPRDTQSTGTGTAGRPAEQQHRRHRRVQPWILNTGKCFWCSRRFHNCQQLEKHHNDPKLRLWGSDAVVHSLQSPSTWQGCGSYQPVGKRPDRPHHKQLFGLGNSGIFRILYSSAVKPLDKHEHKSIIFLSHAWKVNKPCDWVLSTD